jgi:peptidoglycan/xylan/chitin deacetylase (PgdA/CDA1 family)
MPPEPSRRAFLAGAVATFAAACAAGTGTTTAGDGATGSTAGLTTGAGGTGGTTATAPGTAGGGTTALAGSARSTSTTTTGPTSTTATPDRAAASSSSTSSTATPPAPSGTGRAAFVVRGADDSKKVALTFHTNGDLTMAQRLIDVFKDHDAVLTSFIVGNWLAANPTWAKKLLDGGHELANHTYTHPGFASLPPAKMLSEITQCRDTIAKLTTSGGRYFRPSGTDDGRATPSDAILDAAGKAGYPTVLGWDDEPFDYKDPGADTVASRVLDQIKGGSIVSLHFGHEGTILAMPAILDGIKGRGLEIVTVSRLLG